MGRRGVVTPKRDHQVAIVDHYVPVGTSQVTVEDAAGLDVGQSVWIERRVTKKWVNDNGMGNLTRRGKHQTWLYVSEFADP